MFGVHFSGTGDLASWASLAFTVIAGVVASCAFVVLRRRERRQALAELHGALTSGETARARNTIGTLLYSKTKRGLPTRLESIEAYFALIWALQRARNIFRTFGIRWNPLNEPQKRLTGLMRSGRADASVALTWNLTEIAENIVRFHDQYCGIWRVEDKDAWADVGAYVDADRLRQIRDR